MRETGKITWELERELRQVCETVWTTGPQGQRVSLTLPEELVYFALYRAIFEKGKGGTYFWKSVTSGSLSLKDKLCVAHRNRLLEDVLCEYLSTEFNSFAMRTHPLLFADDDNEE